jgi:zinc transporter ZupT
MMEPAERRSLPARQPARAAVVLAGYAVVVTLVGALLSFRFSGPLLPLLCIMAGMALLVPLAVMIPRPRPEGGAPGNNIPVLKRPRPGADQPRQGAPDQAGP